MLDAREVEVYVRPPCPWVDRGVCNIKPDRVYGEGDAAEDLDTGEGHETQVAARGEVIVNRDKLAEFGLAFGELADGQN